MGGALTQLHQNSFAAIPESSAEVLKARTAQALRAFLCLQLVP